MSAAWPSSRSCWRWFASGKVPPVPLSQRPLDQANAVLEELKAGRIIGRAVLTP